MLNQAGIRHLFLAESFKTSDYVAMLDEVARRSARARRERPSSAADAWDALLARRRRGRRRRRSRTRDAGRCDPDDPINIQYTSGTTGFPKGATLSHRNILNNGYFVGELLPLHRGGPDLHPGAVLPLLRHGDGQPRGPTHGATHGHPGAGLRPRPDARARSPQERCTCLYGVPTMFIAEWALPDFATYDLSSVRTGIMAGSPCPAEMMTQAHRRRDHRDDDLLRHDRDLAGLHPDPHRRRLRRRRSAPSAGSDPHLEIKVVDPRHRRDGARAARRASSATKGYSVMLGYWDQPDKTAEVLRDGWMHTGDLAVMDEDGYVQITGRIKDMVIRGGENIYPREIEEFLYTHPDILDAQVIGVPDEKYGEELCAWIRMRRRRRAARRGGGARVRHRQARPLQDPALRPDRRRVPDDRHGQGPQGRDALRDHAPAGAVVSLTIAEAAEQTGLTAHTLRYYERDGLMRTPCAAPGPGTARYDEDDLPGSR